MNGNVWQRSVCRRKGVVRSNSGSNRRQVARQIQAITRPLADPSSEPQATKKINDPARPARLGFAAFGLRVGSVQGLGRVFAPGTQARHIGRARSCSQWFRLGADATRRQPGHRRRPYSCAAQPTGRMRHPRAVRPGSAGERPRHLIARPRPAGQPAGGPQARATASRSLPSVASHRSSISNTRRLPQNIVAHRRLCTTL